MAFFRGTTLENEFGVLCMKFFTNLKADTSNEHQHHADANKLAYRTQSALTWLAGFRPLTFGRCSRVYLAFSPVRQILSAVRHIFWVYLCVIATLILEQ